MKINKRKSFLVLLIIALLAINVFGYSSQGARADDAADIQNKIDDLAKQQKDAQKELDTLQSKLYKNKTQIAATKALVAKIATDIAIKEQNLKDLNNRADLNKVMLSEYVRQIYYAGQADPLAKMSVFQISLSDLSANGDNIKGIKSKIIDTLQIIDAEKNKTEQVKSDLADQKQNNQQVLKTQQVQQTQIVSDVQDAQATLAELNSKINKLKSDLSSLLGVNISTDDVKKAAGIASDATGVRKSFILAELTQESGMGRYTGGCTYKNTKVKPADASAFKDIMKELGYDLNSHKISCAASIGYGGAMGIAQFMPTTWLGYKSYIAGATGHNPPDPWSVIDGVMGMAKKLANGGATSKGGEYNASMRYYCGTPSPANASIKAACKNYAASVQRLANGFENN